MASRHFAAFLAGLSAPIRSEDDLDEFPDIGALFLLEGDERATAEDILMARLAEDDGRAAKALADIRCGRAVPLLAKRALWSPSAAMRDRAAWAAAELSVDRSLPEPLSRLRDDDVDVRLSQVHHDPDAVRAIALLGVRRAVQPLRELLPVTEHVPAATSSPRFDSSEHD